MIVRTRVHGDNPNILEILPETWAELKGKVYDEATPEQKKWFRARVAAGESGEPLPTTPVPPNPPATAVAPLTTGDVPRQPKRRKTG